MPETKSPMALDPQTRYRELFHALDQGFCIFEMIYDQHGTACDYRFLEVNATFERHTGLHHSVGKTARELVPGLEDAWVEVYARVAQTGEQVLFEQGSEAMGRWFEVNAIRLGGEQSRTVALVFTDITARRRAQLALQDSEAQLRATNDAQRRFLSDAAHELRAPLTAIRGNLSLLLRQENISPTERREMLGDAEQESARLARLIADLMTLARGDTHPSLEAAPVRLDRVLEQSLRNARHLSNQHQLEGHRFPALQVLGSEDQLKQLSLVLLENALKYTPPGGRVQVNLYATDGWAQWRVSDTGPGIAAEHLERVFERFYRIPRPGSSAPDPGGTGLGLPIAKQIVQQHGGSIHLESELGVGTTVVVRLPLSVGDAE